MVGKQLRKGMKMRPNKEQCPTDIALLDYPVGEVTIAIINYGTGDLIEQFLSSLMAAQTRVAGSRRIMIREVIVVDSGFPEVADAENFVHPTKYPWPVRIIPNPGHSYSSGVNKAMEEASTDWVFVSNSDVEVIDYEQLEHMVRRASLSEKVAIVCPQLLYPDGQWQRSYGDVPGLLEACKFILCIDVLDVVMQRRRYHSRLSRPVASAQTLKSVGYADGAFLLLSKSAFAAVGGFDESFCFYAEETDYAVRVKRAGYRVCHLGVCPVIHMRGATIQRSAGDNRMMALLVTAKAQFIRKHHSSVYARLYKWLTCAGALWRATLSEVMWRLTGDPRWRYRAKASKTLTYLVWKA